MNAPNRLRIHRFLAGLSQGELAAAAGLSQAAISSYEIGHALPRLRNAERIAEILRVEVGDLWPELIDEVAA